MLFNCLAVGCLVYGRSRRLGCQTLPLRLFQACGISVESLIYYLAAKALNKAPVWDVAELSHECQIQYWVPEHSCLETLRMLP